MIVGVILALFCAAYLLAMLVLALPVLVVAVVLAILDRPRARVVQSDVPLVILGPGGDFEREIHVADLKSGNWP